MLLNARRIYRQANLTEMMLVAIQDITERKRVEETLRQSECRMRIVLDNALEAVAGIDARGTITHWNLRAESPHLL